MRSFDYFLFTLFFSPLFFYLSITKKEYSVFNSDGLTFSFVFPLDYIILFLSQAILCGNVCVMIFQFFSLLGRDCVTSISPKLLVCFLFFLLFSLTVIRFYL
uniref:(northern house mosquito) hypothetical protein n=1 Tax=Culex pipiens TaxID=7175 RepID=A0A8D8H8R9_CULPI